MKLFTSWGGGAGPRILRIRFVTASCLMRKLFDTYPEQALQCLEHATSLVHPSMELIGAQRYEIDYRSAGTDSTRYSGYMPERKKKAPPIHHADEFGLDPLASDDDLFRWFLLAFLFGKPIQSSVAVQTWKLFVSRKIDTPWAISDKSEPSLVGILHAGKYTRYQHVTARALHTCMDQLIRGYDGSLMYMMESSENEEEFSKRLQKLYGVGPKTAQIFMRETEEHFARRVE